jgi:hypothetical protein
LRPGSLKNNKNLHTQVTTLKKSHTIFHVCVCVSVCVGWEEEELKLLCNCYLTILLPCSCFRSFFLILLLVFFFPYHSNNRQPIASCNTKNLEK